MRRFANEIFYKLAMLNLALDNYYPTVLISHHNFFSNLSLSAVSSRKILNPLLNLIHILSIKDIVKHWPQEYSV